MAFGPIQIIAVGFPTTDRFEGRIADELIKLSDAGTIRIVDLLAVLVEDDEVDIIRATDLSDAQREMFGAQMGALIGLGVDGIDGFVAGAESERAGDRPVDPQIRRERERAAAVAPPSVAAAPVGNVAVQVGAFGTSQAAERLANSLRSKGFPVYVSPGTKAGDVRWRVRVGPLANRKEAEGTAARLKKVEKLPTWILNEDAS